MNMLSVGLGFNLRCLASQFLRNNIPAQFSGRNISFGRSKKKEEEKTDFRSIIEKEEEEEELKAREAAIEKKRNKSGLHPDHFNRQHDRPPYEKPEFDFHESLIYRRRQYGKYGEKSKVDPSILWPSKEELDYMKEYEEISQPFTFQTLCKNSRDKKALAEEAIKNQEAQILEKVKNVKRELLEFHKRHAIKRQKRLELIEEKNKLINKVRMKHGYKIDVKTDEFRKMFDALLQEKKNQEKLEKKQKQEEMKSAESSQEKTE